VSENITLYAKWTRAEVTVRFDANGHGTAPQAQTIPMGGTAVKPQDPQERGWVFGGWYMEPACVTEFDFTTPVSENITLYAKWTPADVPETLNGEDHYAYIIGYSDGTVRPGANMTRAEAATIFFRLLNADAREANLTRESSFTDVPKNAWFATAVSTLAKQGILKGVTDTTFQPEASITRAELVVICVRFHGGANGETSQFPDVSGHWAESEIARAASLGWVDGYEDGTFRPDEPITRAEAVTLINRVLKRLPESGDALLKDMNVWPDCQPGDWYYLAIQEASNSHDYKYTKGFCETWTGMRQTPDWKQYEAVAE
ncbi:MAG: S-layer homology domain-containing protein, partial [Faecousia sp.]